ncbi:MAG: hypothetical protein ACTHMG_07865 [Sphingomonas sp.]
MVSDDPFLAMRARRSSWRGTAILAVLSFIIGIAVMALAFHYYASRLPWLAPATQNDRQAGSALRKGSSTAAASEDYGALAAREAALGARLSDLESRTSEIDTQAAAASGNATRAEGLLVAFAARRALDRGLGLGYIEGQLRARFGAANPRAVAMVIQASRQPVTLEDLRLGLNTIGPDLISGANQGWTAGLRSAFSNLIVIHRQGEPSPLPSDRLSRARHLLEGGQVEAALAEVAKLPGAPKAQRWMTAAHRYVEARHALDVIETAAILGQATRPAPPPAAANPAPANSDAAPQAGNPAAAAPTGATQPDPAPPAGDNSAAAVTAPVPGNATA